MTMSKMKAVLDAVLEQNVNRLGGSPGVVAMATNRQGNFYEGAAGVRELGKDCAMTTDSVLALFSTTKALAGVCLMQLVEEGLLSLDDPAGRYVPDIDELQVLDGFDADGQPRTRQPRRRITINDLMLHTSGLGYEFFSRDDLKFRTARRVPTVVSSVYPSIRTVLLHDPGEAWTYGVNLDWVGLVVESVRGRRLGEVMRQRVFEPLEMHDIGFTMSEAMAQRRASIHDRAADGRLTPLPELALPQPAVMDCGGHGLYGSVGDYMKFIRMMLNDGAGPNGRVLQPGTVAAMCEDGLAGLGLSAGGWTTSIPSLSNTGGFFPGSTMGWGRTFMINREDTPSGRPAGSLMWAGLANCYFWIDRKNGLGGYWGTQILPFQDAVSYPGFVEFETAVYHYR